MPRLNIYLPDEVHELAMRWRDTANLSEICATAIKDELSAVEGARGYSRVLTKIRPSNKMEGRLLHAFGLADAVTAEAPDDPKRLRDSIGGAAASYLDTHLCDGSLIAIAGGRQTWSVVQQLSPRRIRSMIFALGMHRADPQLLHAHPNTLATLMWLLYSPRSQAYVVGSMPQSNPWLEALPPRAHPSYFVISSCSRFEENSPFANLVGSGLAKSLIARQVAGDYAYVFFDRRGRELTIPQSEDQFRLPARLLRDLSRRSDARTILVAGGDDKLDVLRNALRSKLCNTLITDEGTAERLLNSHGDGQW